MDDLALQRAAEDLERTLLPAQLIELPNGTLRELGREYCSGCRKPMPDPESGEMCYAVPGKGVYHADCPPGN